jgi:hypothetical protein
MGQPDGSPVATQRRGLLVLVAAACLLIVVAAVVGYGHWRTSTVADGDLVMVVRHSQVLEVLAPGAMTAQVDVTIENTTGNALEVTEASLGGFGQPVSASLAAHGSADLPLHVQVFCSDQPRLLSMEGTVTVAAPDGGSKVVAARVVESGTADELMAECKQKMYGTN